METANCANGYCCVHPLLFTGQKLACLEVEGEKKKNIVTKGSNGRKAMREVSNMKTENVMITPAEGTNISKNAIIGLK